MDKRIILLTVFGLIATSVGIRLLSNHSNPLQYIFPVLFIVGGSVMYFISILYLGAKNRGLIIVMIVIGWIVAVILNIFLWRQNFYFVCQPWYYLTNEDIQGWNSKDLDLGSGVFGLRLEKPPSDSDRT